MNLRWLALPMACAALAASACGPRKTTLRPKPGETAGAAKPGATVEYDPTATPPVEVAEADIRGTEFAAAEGIQIIHFDYDAYALDEAARATLKGNADTLKRNPEMEVLVAGHCDDRGTLPYNLALGQRRAKAVREYYIRLGVPGKSVATISYGEEQALCSESTEDCWASNRRAETRVRARTAHNHHPGTATPAPR